jgi:hypothetical protein
MFGSYLWFLPRAFFTHGGRGCERHPAFPAPSLLEGTTPRSTRADHAARMRTYVRLFAIVEKTFVEIEASASAALVIPGRAKREPGIHNHMPEFAARMHPPADPNKSVPEYGLRARPTGAPE